MRNYIIGILIMVGLTAKAALVTVDAPPRVEQGSSFQIVFSVSGSTDDCDINFPHQLGWANYLYGPARGVTHSSSITIINGKRSSSSSSSVTLTYTFRALKKGKYTIPSATVTVDGKTLRSAPRSIDVVEDQGGADPYQMSPRSQSPVPSADPFTQTAGNGVSENDAFVRVEMSKPTVYEQEAVVGSVKLYTRYPGQVQCTKLPQFDGFLIEELPTDRNNPKPEVATVKGQKYYCFEMSRYILYPQQSGKLTITPGEYDITVQQHDVYSSLGMSISIPVNTTIHVKSNSAAVTITPLPEPRPAGFSGAVGNFKAASTLTPADLRTYSPVTYSLIINGTGNLKYIQAPAITFPREFDSYDPQTNLGQANAGSSDVSGQVKFDYRLIPQFVGNYTIPAVKFIYFNTSTHNYETINVPARDVKVAKGKGKPSSHYQLRNRDIEDIDRATDVPDKDGRHLVSSWWYWLLFASPLLLLAVYVPIYRKWARDHANDRLMRRRRANKVARRRLKTAGALISANNANGFYAEVLNAIWGYLSDKLNIPRSSLSKENITAEMEKFGFDENQRKRTIELLDQCEFAQYAPELASADLSTVYDNVASLMDELENVKKNKQGKSSIGVTTAIVIVFLIQSLSIFTVNAEAVVGADSLITQAALAYDSHNYQKAMQLYQQVRHDYGANASLYYNMGNTAYRMKDRAHAILYYERALKLDPSYRNARTNLLFVREKTQVDPNNAITAGGWLNGLMSRLSTDGWALLALALFSLSVLGVAVIITTESRGRRLLAFYGSIVLFLLSIGAIACAVHLHHLQSENNKAIITSTSAKGYKSPHITVQANADEKDETQSLTNGVKVEIIDKVSEKDNNRNGRVVVWYKIKTAEGAKLWVPATDIEII